MNRVYVLEPCILWLLGYSITHGNVALISLQGCVSLKTTYNFFLTKNDSSTLCTMILN